MSFIDQVRDLDPNDPSGVHISSVVVRLKDNNLSPHRYWTGSAFSSVAQVDLFATLTSTMDWTYTDANLPLEKSVTA